MNLFMFGPETSEEELSEAVMILKALGFIKEDSDATEEKKNDSD